MLDCTDPDACSEVMCAGVRIPPALEAACRAVMADAAPDETLVRGKHGMPYLRRWWLRRPAAAEPSNSAIYLHEIVLSDVPPPHTHPWASESLVIAGRLLDEQYGQGGGIVRSWDLPRGTVMFRPAAHCHVLSPLGGPALTLFATGPRTQPWGFLRADGTVGRDRGQHRLLGRRAHLPHAQIA